MTDERSRLASPSKKEHFDFRCALATSLSGSLFAWPRPKLISLPVRQAGQLTCLRGARDGIIELHLRHDRLS